MFDEENTFRKTINSLNVLFNIPWDLEYFRLKREEKKLIRTHTLSLSSVLRIIALLIQMVIQKKKKEKKSREKSTKASQTVFHVQHDSVIKRSKSFFSAVQVCSRNCKF